MKNISLQRFKKICFCICASSLLIAALLSIWRVDKLGGFLWNLWLVSSVIFFSSLTLMKAIKTIIKKSKKQILYCIGVILFIFLSLYSFFSTESEYTRIKSPDGNYLAIISYKNYLSFLPMSPGSSGDKPGFIEMFDDKTGDSLGKMPLGMISYINDMDDLWWIEDEISFLGGSWNLKDRSCKYWNEEQTKELNCWNQKK